MGKLRYTAAACEDKIKAILNKVYAGMMYGIEGSDITEAMTAKIAAAVIDVFRSRNDVHDADWFFTAISNGTSRELDPTVQILVRRCLELRRAICKRPKTLAKAQSIFASYVKNNPDAGKWCEDTPSSRRGDVHKYPHPIQHPTRGTNDTWKKQVGATGPIGLIIQSVLRTGAKASKDFVICKPN